MPPKEIRVDCAQIRSGTGRQAASGKTPVASQGQQTRQPRQHQLRRIDTRKNIDQEYQQLLRSSLTLAQHVRALSSIVNNRRQDKLYLLEANEGQKLNITCQVGPSQPASQIIWFKRHIQLLPGESHCQRPSIYSIGVATGCQWPSAIQLAAVGNNLISAPIFIARQPGWLAGCFFSGFRPQ